MTLRLEDLPPQLRKQAEAKLGTRAKTPRTTAAGSSKGSCHSCDWTGTYSAWERKHAASGHARFDIDLEDACLTA